jgi:phage repressor protein C with HTH and peptisase S24 domain
MASAVGVSQSKMSRLINEAQDSIDPYLEVASLASSELSIPIEKITKPRPTQRADDQTQPPLLLYEDVVVGAGNSVRPIEEWEYVHIQIPRRVIRTLIGHDTVPDPLYVNRVRGESMYPEIQGGDYVVWTPEEEVVDGGTYVIRFDEGILLKVLQRKPGQRLRIHSLNPEFTDDVIKKTGRGVWVTDTEEKHRVDFDVHGRFLNVIQPKDLYRSSQRVHDLMTAYKTINEGVTPV